MPTTENEPQTRTPRRRQNLSYRINRSPVSLELSDKNCQVGLEAR